MEKICTGKVSMNAIGFEAEFKRRFVVEKVIQLIKDIDNGAI